MRAASDLNPRGPASPDGGGPLRIAVVDDDPFLLQLLAQQLARADQRDVACYSSGNAALAPMEPIAAWDLVLLDLNMPDCDGITLLRRLVERGFRGSVALVSGEEARIVDSVARLARAHGLHLAGQLSKPVDFRAIKALLDGVRHDRPVTRENPREEYGAEEIGVAIRSGQLVNHYQPQVRLSDGGVVAVETLVRWHHPRDGLIYPDRFIPVAESSGLIVELTRKVLVEAIAAASRWRRDGHALHVAVNVSAHDMAALEFPDFVLQTLVDQGLEARDLTLEVTESKLLSRHITELEVLSRLRLRGTGISIDDFGTGHSSLAQLRDTPFSELKIDRGFVHGASTNATARAIVQASIAMARQLGIKAVAEGVEDRDDWELLRTLGCEMAQGYYIARPMPEERIAPWLVEWEKGRGERAHG